MRQGEPQPRSTTKGQRVPGRLVAVGSALVLSIYTAGYLRTESSAPRFDIDRALQEIEAAAAVAPPLPAQPALTPTLEPTAEPTPEPEPATTVAVAAAQSAPPPPTARPASAPTPRPTAAPAPPPPPSPAATSGYRDGTYSSTGSAWNHGTLTVTVVISGGQIVSARVSSATIRYPSNDVDPLVAEAVRRQTVPLSNVSGATASADGYREAFIKALAQAR